MEVFFQFTDPTLAHIKDRRKDFRAYQHVGLCPYRNETDRKFSLQDITNERDVASQGSLYKFPDPLFHINPVSMTAWHVTLVGKYQ